MSSLMSWPSRRLHVANLSSFSSFPLSFLSLSLSPSPLPLFSCRQYIHSFILAYTRNDALRTPVTRFASSRVRARAHIRAHVLTHARTLRIADMQSATSAMYVNAEDYKYGKSATWESLYMPSLWLWFSFVSFPFFFSYSFFFLLFSSFRF